MSTAALGLLLLAPVVAGALSTLGRSARVSGRISAGCSLLYASAWLLVAAPAQPTAFVGGPFFVDGLSAYMVGLISVVAILAAAFSAEYMAREVDHGATTLRRVRVYYLFFHTFIACMYLAVTVNSLGLMWVAIEATTLTSAVLVGHYGKRHSLEAAWKYLIICSLGIAFALFGTVLLYQGAILAGVSPHAALNLSALTAIAGRLNPALIKLAFVFLLVGYGTKAGLAPMHTWLPDAHSQAPSPMSAVLSAVLLNCALYGVLRAGSLVAASAGPAFAGNLLIGFGILSMGVAVPFLMVQRDLKRLLAYSSVEHMGIISVGMGLGFTQSAGASAAFLHMLFHALGKMVLFFAAGKILQRFGTKRMARVRGLMAQDPWLGGALLIGILAISGLPPFGLFVSELAIASAGFGAGRWGLTSVFLILLALAFAAMIYHGGAMLFGEPRARSMGERGVRKRDLLAIAALIVPIVLLAVFGLHIPSALRSAVAQAVAGLRPL